MSKCDEEDRQNALADVFETARLLHEMRALALEVERLHRGAIDSALSTGLSKAIVAGVCGVTAGRISQIAAEERKPISADALRHEVYDITEWPQRALSKHSSTFPGQMMFPPYPRRRSS